ncbi:MAG: DUF6883 domain-containing protein [Elainellaceae cyanobacterium]
MGKPQTLIFSLAKAEYLLTRVAQPGQGGDKKNFWQNILGFEDAETIREAILKVVSIDKLEPIGQNEYGDRYQAIVRIIGSNGISRYVTTIWIVIFEEDAARFVTAFPAR